ncbi:hypothetical protein PWT90_05908 [Aphanocladium album]|nr:hypothetical protein PWT90_05908 [Aphanocladium album]
MKKARERTGFLDLPLELRRIIILHVLKHRRPKEPVLKQRDIDGRVRLQNCFDPNYPTETNIYVEKERNERIHGNGLLRTCRLLRRDTLDLIADTVETGKAKMPPFVLDMMLVKGVGFFPTWMSFPYPAKRIKKLRVNVRIFRPKKGIVPLDWIRAGQYKADDYEWCQSPFTWNLWVVLLFYAMGRLSPSPANTIQADRVVTPPADAMRADTDSVPAYLSAHAPYSVNEMFVSTHELEYSADGKAYRGYVEDKLPQLEYYQEGYSAFGHEIFRHDQDDYYDHDEHYLSIRNAGKNAFSQFSDASVHALNEHLLSYYRVYPYRYHEPSRQIYVDAAAKYIQRLQHTYYSTEWGVVSGGCSVWLWEHVLTSPFEAAGLAKAYKIEKKKPHPDEEILHLFTLIKWRIDAGWWDNDMYKRLWEN